MKADISSRVLYCKAGKEYIINNKDNIVSASMIATVDLFKGLNFDYTATSLRDERLLELRAHQDETYEHLKKTIIKDGWPEKQIDLHPGLETFWSHKEKLSIDNGGFIIKNGRLLVPAGLHQTYLSCIRSAEKMNAKSERPRLTLTLMTFRPFGCNKQISSKQIK